VQTALQLFWRQGYQATSLDDLTAAMRLSRSSFYACFASKHAMLIRALSLYADGMFEALSGLARSGTEPLMSVRGILAAVADAQGGDRGCFLVNCVTELAPHDPELAGLARTHIARVSTLVAALLVQSGFPRDLAERRASALLSCAIGATMLRKAGMAAAAINALLAETDILIVPTGAPIP
jgi:TetR/AcrR family transcriptional repressor of nem operon